MQTAMQALSTSQPGESSELVLPERAVIALFDELDQQLGTKAADFFHGQDRERVQETWSRHLGAMHLKRFEMERGLAGLARRRFPPTLGEFAVMCRPALDPELAWYEAEECLQQRDAGERGDWTHPAVFRAASRMWEEVRSGDYKKHRTRWKFLLERELARGFKDGVPEAPKRVAHTENKPSPPTPEMLARLRRLADETRASIVPLSLAEQEIADNIERAERVERSTRGA